MIMMIPPLETQIICLSVRVVRARECQVIKEGWEFPSVCELKYKFSRRCDSWPFNWFCWCEVWFRASHKDAKPFGDWPKMGDDCDSIDIVSLQTPSNEYSIGELKFWLNLLTKEIWGNAKVWLAWQAMLGQFYSTPPNILLGGISVGWPLWTWNGWDGSHLSPSQTPTNQP